MSPRWSRPITSCRPIFASGEDFMRGDENREMLSAPAEQLVELAREELGEMSARRRAEGYAKLSARRSPRNRRARLMVSFAAVLTVAALVFGARRWLGHQNAGALSYALDGGRIGPEGAIEAT